MGARSPRRATTASAAECPEFGRCHVVAARRAAQEADIVVVNHHLLLADLAMKDEGFGESLPGAEAVCSTRRTRCRRSRRSSSAIADAAPARRAVARRARRAWPRGPCAWRRRGSASRALDETRGAARSCDRGSRRAHRMGGIARVVSRRASTRLAMRFWRTQPGTRVRRSGRPGPASVRAARRRSSRRRCTRCSTSRPIAACAGSSRARAALRCRSRRSRSRRGSAN